MNEKYKIQIQDKRRQLFAHLQKQYRHKLPALFFYEKDKSMIHLQGGIDLDSNGNLYREGIELE